MSHWESQVPYLRNRADCAFHFEPSVAPINHRRITDESQQTMYSCSRMRQVSALFTRFQSNESKMKGGWKQKPVTWRHVAGSHMSSQIQLSVSNWSTHIIHLYPQWIHMLMLTDISPLIFFINNLNFFYLISFSILHCQVDLVLLIRVNYWS